TADHFNIEDTGASDDAAHSVGRSLYAVSLRKPEQKHASSDAHAEHSVGHSLYATSADVALSDSLASSTAAASSLSSTSTSTNSGIITDTSSQPDWSAQFESVL